MSRHPLILTLDQHGVPHRWVSWQHACVYVARDLVAWDAGDTQFILSLIHISEPTRPY